MARFLGVTIQTDISVAVPVGTTPSRRAFFRADGDLLSCVAVHSPTEPESAMFEVQRDDPRCVEIVLGRVFRLTHEGATGDTEWDITGLEDGSSADRLIVRGTPILMRLARVVYMGETSIGTPEPAWTGVLLTATEWLDLLVIPALAAAGMPFEVGTVDSTNRFTMDGEWNSVLEIVNAIAEPGRANAEIRLSAGGDYGYVIDLLDQIGESAATVRVRTGINLLDLKRNRDLTDVATRLFPRGSSQSVVTRTMSDHLWRVQSVVSGTVLELEDIAGGADPILYDDQVNGLYFAPITLGEPTFASQVVSDSVASTTQRITVASTAGISAGDWGRFFADSGAGGTRVTSLTHPVLVQHPSDAGYGDRALILDRPAIVADCNLIRNATMRTWTNASNPPDDWAEFAEDPSDVVFSKVTTDGPADFTECFEVELAVGGGNVAVVGAYYGGTEANAVQGPAICIESPAAQPWDTAGRTYCATVWIKVMDAPSAGKISMYLHDEDRVGLSTTENAELYQPSNDAGLIGTWVKGTDDEDVWTRFQSAAMDLSGIGAFTPLTTVLSGRVRLRVELGTTGTPSVANVAGAWQGVWDAGTGYNTNDYVSHSGGLYVATGATTGDDPDLGGPWNPVSGAVRVASTGWKVRVCAVTLSESPTPIADRELSGGTELWQAANAELPSLATAIKGYDLSVADLAADDGTTYATLAFTPGGLVEVIDTDLDLTTTLRLVEYTRDYLDPLASQLRVGSPPDRFTEQTDSLRPSTIGSGA